MRRKSSGSPISGDTRHLVDRFAALICLVLTATSCTQAPAAEPSRSTPQPAEASGPSPEELARANAIDLAKGAKTLKGPGIVPLSNEILIKRMVSELKGDMTILGWRADPVDIGVGTYLVTFKVVSNREESGWPFEVNVPTGIVRYVIGDKELERKYGWEQK